MISFALCTFRCRAIYRRLQFALLTPPVLVVIALTSFSIPQPFSCPPYVATSFSCFSFMSVVTCSPHSNRHCFFLRSAHTQLSHPTPCIRYFHVALFPIVFLLLPDLLCFHPVYHVVHGSRYRLCVISSVSSNMRLRSVRG